MACLIGLNLQGVCMNGFGYGNQFYAYVDNEGFIIATDYTGQKKIGVTLGKFNNMEKMANEAISKAEGYYKTLVDHGLIERELTQDEKISALTEQVQTLTMLMEKLVIDKNVNNNANETPDKQTPVARDKDDKSVSNSGNGKGFIASEQPLA